MLVVVAVLAGAIAPQYAGGRNQEEPEGLPASGWTVVDAHSGETLASRRAKVSKPIASATKLMTYLVAARRLDLGAQVANAPYSPGPLESVAGFEAGDRIQVSDLLYGLMLASGNDAATTLALASYPSASRSVEAMNANAARLGLEQTRFVDPIGLDAENVSSPEDLADLTMKLREQPRFRQVVAAPRRTVRSGGERVVLVNRNGLVRTTGFVDGVKTGTTLEAGYILVASARRRGVALISVVTGAPSEEARDEATLDLLDFGFSLYRKRSVVNAGDVVGRIELEGGNAVKVAAAESVTALARRDQRPVLTVRGGDSVDLPISRGEVIGKVVVAIDGRRIGRVDAVATRDLEFASARSEDANLVLPILLSCAALALAVIGVQGARAVRRSR